MTRQQQLAPSRIESDENITVEDVVTTAQGQVELRANNDIFVNGTTVTSGTTGDVLITADANSDNAGEVALDDTSSVNAAAGNITISAGEDITVSNLVSTSTSGQAVNLTAGGRIRDAGDTNVDVVATAGGLDITSAGGVEGIETTVAVLDLSNSTSGNVVVNETDDLQIDVVSNVNGDITLSTSGNITDNASDNAADFVGGTLTISAPATIGAGANGSLDLNVTTASVTGVSGDAALNAVGTGGVALTVATNAAGNIVLSGSEDLTLTSVTTSAGDITVTTSGSANVTATAVTAGGGNVAVTGAGDLVVNAITASAGAATLDLDGAIRNDTGAAGIIANTVTVTDATQVGITGGSVDIDADLIDISGVSGAVDIDALDINAVGSTTSIVAITTTAAGDITLDGPKSITIRGLTTSNGNVTIDTAGAIANELGTAAAEITTNQLTITQGASFGATGNLTDVDASVVNISGVTGDVAFDAVGAGGVDITVTSSANVEITGGENLVIRDINAASGDVSLTTSAQIINAVDNATAEVTTAAAGNLTIGGATRVGDPDNNGALDVNTGNINVSGVSGDVAIDAIGGDGVNIQVATTAAGDITLTGNENLNISQISAASGNISLATTGQIQRVAGNTTDVIGNQLIVTDADEIGTAGTGSLLVDVNGVTASGVSGAVEINPVGSTNTTFSIATDQAGNITIDGTGGTGDVLIGNIVTNNGDVTVSSAAAIGVDGTDAAADVTTNNFVVGQATNVTGLDLDSNTVDINSVSGAVTIDAIGTGGTTVSVDTTAAGNVTIGGSDNLSFGNVTTSAGNVVVDTTGSLTSAVDDGTADITTTEFVVTDASSVGTSGSGLEVSADIINVTGVGGEVNIESIGGAATDVTAKTDAAGDIQISGGGNLEIEEIATTNGNVTLSTTGTIENNSADTTAEVITTQLNITGATQVGAASNGLDINADTINITGVSSDITFDAVGTGGVNITAANTGVGNITIVGSEDLTLTNVLATNGLIDVSTAAGFNIFGISVQGNGTDDDDDILLTAGANGSVVLTSVRTSGSGDVTVNAGSIVESGTAGLTNPGPEVVTDVFTVGSGSQFGAGPNGAVDVDASRIDVSVTGSVGVDAVGTGGVALDITSANGDITINSTTEGFDLDQLTASNGNVTLSTTGGAIASNPIDAGVADITTNNLVVSAANSFGAGSPVDIDVTTASITGIGGAIQINSTGTGGLTLGAATTNAGQIAVTSGESVVLNTISTTDGAISVTGNADLSISNTGSVTAGGTARDVTLTVDADNNSVNSLTINGAVTASGNIALSGGATANDTATVKANLRSNGTAAGSNLTVQNFGSAGLSNIELRGLAIDLDNNLTTLNILGDTNMISGGGNVALNAVVNTGSDLTINATDTGALTINSLTGTGGNLEVVDASGVTITGTVNAGTMTFGALNSGNVSFTGTGADSVTAANLVLSNTGGVITFSGSTTLGSITTAVSPYQVQFLGTSTSVAQDVTFSNTGGLVLGNDETDQLSLGRVTATGIAVSLEGNVTTTGRALEFGNVTMTGNASINTALDGGGVGDDIRVGAVNGGGSLLTLNAGTGGDIVFGGAVDFIPTLTLTNAATVDVFGRFGENTQGNITVNTLSGTGATFRQRVDAQDVTFGAGTSYSVTFNDIVNVGGNLTTGSTSGSINFVGNTTVAGNAQFTASGAGSVTFSQSAILGGDATFNLATGSVNFNDIATVTGNATFNQTGGLKLGSTGENIQFNNGLTYTVGTTQLGGNVTTTGDAIVLDDINMIATSILDTTNNGASAAGANVTIDAIAGNGSANLRIDAGTGGDLSVTGAINNMPLLTLTNSTNATFGGQIGAIGAGNITVTDTQAGGNITFNQDVNFRDFVTSGNTAYNLAFVGTNNVIGDPVLQNAVTFTNSGNLTFGDSGVDTMETYGINIPNANTFLAGTLSTLGNDLAFTQLNIVDNTTAILSTQGGNVTVAGVLGSAATTAAESLSINAGVTGQPGGNVTFTGAVTGNVGQLTNVTVQNANNINFSGNVSLPGNLIVTSADGTTQFTSPVSVGSANLESALVDVNADFTANNGFTTSAALNLGGNITTSGGVVNVGGNLSLDNASNISVVTAGGNVTVSGTIQGNSGAGAESLTLNVNNPVGNLTDGAVSIAALQGDENGVGTADGLTTFTLIDAASIILGDVRLFGGLSLGTVGNITQLANTTFTVGGLLDLSANSVNLTGLTAPAGVNLTIADDATLSMATSQGVSLSGTVGGDLAVTANGTIDIRAGQNHGITGTSSFVSPGANITLNTLQAAGQVSLTGADVSVINNQAINLGAVTATGAGSIVASSGAITGGSAVQITGQTTLTANAGTGITLTNANNQFGNLIVSATQAGSAVNLRENGDSNLTTVNAVGFTLESGGLITDATGSTFAVSGITSLKAEGAITLNNGTTTIATLAIPEANQVTINNSSGMVLNAINATGLNLTAAGAIVDTESDVVAVSGNSTFAVGSNNLTLNNANLGTLNLTNAGDVTVDEVDTIVLGSINAANLEIDAAGAISQSAGSNVNVSNLFNLISLSDITLDGVNSFQSLQLNGVNVTIKSTGSLVLQNITATTLTVDTSGGNISQQAGSTINVAGLADISTVGGNIVLTDKSSTFGSVDLSGNLVNFAAASDIKVDGIVASTLTLDAGGAINVTTNGITAGTATLVAGGNVSGSALFSVTGAASITAAGSLVELKNVNNVIDTLSVTASIVDLSLADDIDLNQVNVTNGFTIASTGNITDASASSINVGAMTLGTTGDIVLGDTGALSLSSINMRGGLINLSLDSGAVIESLTGNSLTLSAGGAITQGTGINSSVDVNSAIFSNAGNDITLAGADNAFGSLQIVNAGNVTITDKESLRLNAINAGNLTLNTGGITDGGDVKVSGTFSVDARAANILLNQNDHEFGTMVLEGGVIRINEADGSNIGSINANLFDLQSGGDVTSTGTVVANTDLNIRANSGFGSITLGNAQNRLDRLSLTGSDITVQNSSDTELVLIDANRFTLTSTAAAIDNGDVSNPSGASIEVGGLLTINAGTFDIALGDSEGNSTVELGSVNLTGGSIQLTQTDAENLVLENVTAASNLSLTSVSGNITSLTGGNVSSVGPASFVAGGDSADNPRRSISLGTSTNDFGTLTMRGLNITLAETGDVDLSDVRASGELTINAGGNITNASAAGVRVDSFADASLTAGGNITLGTGGDADTINFGTLSLDAQNATIEEDSETELSKVNVRENLNLTVQKSLTDVESQDTAITVGGLATLRVEDQPQLIELNGEANSIAAMNLASQNITINLVGDTQLTNVVSDNFNLVAETGVVTITEGANFTIGQSGQLRSRSIVFAEGSNNVVGDLNLSTRTGGSVDIRSSLTAREGAASNFLISAPNVFVGSTDTPVAITSNGGNVTITGVSASGAPQAVSSFVHLSGEVDINTFIEGGQSGNIFIASDGLTRGTIRQRDGAGETKLTLTAGNGDVNLGDFDSLSRVASLGVNSADNVFLGSVYLFGNTLNVNAGGNVTVSGTIDDADGSVNISAGESISVAEATSARGNISLSASRGSVAVNDLNAGSNISAVATGSILLGSNTTAGGTGTVTLVSQDSVESAGTITSGGKSTVIASNNISLGTGGGASIQSGGDVVLTADQGNVSITDVSASGTATLFSVAGKVSQQKNTVLSATGQVTISAQTGIEIASIQASDDVTLVINQQGLNADGTSPAFTRVNDPIPLGQGDTNPDIGSGGAIVFLAPSADVGSANVGQNFVQRSSVGIFYGLDQGSFFSDDIGGSSILNSIPSDTIANLTNATQSATSFTVAEGTSVADPVQIDATQFNASLDSSANATASAGETSAVSSSRSTAASQRDDEEEVDEVDEVAFQNLKNYDENPQGILLPEDQSFAYDEDGNIYLIVTMGGVTQESQPETFTLYKVQLDLLSNELVADADDKEDAEEDVDNLYGYRPEFLKLSFAGGEG